MTRLLRFGRIGLVGFAALAMPRLAAADAFPPRAERILSPGRSAAAEDSAEALVLNPANLANLPGSEFRWTGVNCPDTRKVGCGHAFDLATPLFWGLSTGFRLDYVMPPATALFPFASRDYAWLTWALAYKLSERLQLGASVEWSYSGNPYTDGLFGLTVGASYRMNSHFGLALVAQDFNGPSSQNLPFKDYPVMDRTFVAAAVFRPTGTRAIELGVEGRYFDGIDQARPRANLGVDIPGVGRIRGDIEIQHLGNDDRRGILATAGAEIYLNHLSAGGGALFGNGLGDVNSVGEYATASITSYRLPGVPRPDRAVSIRLESTPGTRTHVRLLRRL
jgi:hypothetical protein